MTAPTQEAERIEYKQGIIRIAKREGTNDYIYSSTFPYQTTGLAVSRDSALSQAKADIDAFKQGKK